MYAPGSMISEWFDLILIWFNGTSAHMGHFSAKWSTEWYETLVNSFSIPLFIDPWGGIDDVSAEISLPPFSAPARLGRQTGYEKVVHQSVPISFRALALSLTWHRRSLVMMGWYQIWWWAISVGFLGLWWDMKTLCKAIYEKCNIRSIIMCGFSCLPLPLLELGQWHSLWLPSHLWWHLWS